MVSETDEISYLKLNTHLQDVFKVTCGQFLHLRHVVWELPDSALSKRWDHTESRNMVNTWAEPSRPSADHWLLLPIKLNYKLVLSRWCCTKDANHVCEQSPPHPKLKLVHKINDKHSWHIDTITKMFAECILVRVWWVMKRSFKCAR